MLVSAFYVLLLQLPVFFKLCQDGVWGVRKVSCPQQKRTVVIVPVKAFSEDQY